MLRFGGLLVLVVFMVFSLVSAQSVSAANIDNCSLLDTAGETYVLTQDILDSPNTTCMNITADNVTLDCNGSKIDGVYSSNTLGVHAENRENVTVKNCNITDWWFGVHLNLTCNSTVFSNNFTHNDHGFDINNSVYNNISDNFLESVTYGIYASNSTNNSIGNNFIRNGTVGIGFYSYSNTNMLFGNFLESFDDYAVYLYQSRINFFRDSRINTTAKNVYHYSSGDTVFLNVSLDKTEIQVGAGAVHMKWYLDVGVLSKGGLPLDQANMTGKDKYNVTVFSELTNTSGYIERQNVTEFHQNFSGKFFYNNYTINATKPGYVPNQTLVEVTTNMLFTVYLSEIIPPSVQAKTYTLGLEEKYIFRPGKLVRIRAEVACTNGREYIINSTVLIRNNLGSVIVNNELMTNISEITNGYLYEYNYTLPSNAEGLWFINVTATDSFGWKGSDSFKIAITPPTIQVKLVLNSTSDSIYIPGTGERTFSGLTTNEYSNPDHYYIASYSNDVLKSVVFSYMSPLSIFTEKGSNTYGIGTNQRFSNSMVFLVFSRGDWRNVNNRISSIENGEFLSNPKPSFSYGLGDLYPLKIVLGYENIDLNRTLKTGRGLNRLVIEKKGMVGDKINLEIKRS